MTYCIVPFPPTAEQYAAAIESPDTVRRSLDDSECVLKWSGNTPPAFDGLTLFNHAEVIVVMQSAAWTAPMPHGGGDD